MLTGTLILLGILIPIIMLHEAGHLVMAKRFGVKVSIFSIGFGPRIIGVKFFRGKRSYKFFNRIPTDEYVWELGETEYRLAPIPFGGFCAMNGEVCGDAEGSLASKPFYQKFLVIAGGIIVNLVTGFTAIAGVAIAKLGFLTGLKTSVFAVKEMIVQAYLQTVALITGLAPLAKWEEISEASSSMASVEGIILQFGFYSIILALFNALPIPALDGSYPFLWGLEAIFGKDIGRAIATALVYTGFILIMGLQLFIVYYWIFM